MLNIFKNKYELDNLRLKYEKLETELKYYEEKKKEDKDLIVKFGTIYINTLNRNELHEVIKENLNDLSTEELTKICTHILSNCILLIRSLTSIDKNKSYVNDEINNLIIRYVSDSIHNLPRYLLIGDREGLIREIPYYLVDCDCFLKTENLLKNISEDYSYLYRKLNDFREIYNYLYIKK